MSTPRIAPSILAADFLHLGEQARAAERGGADRLHLDVMDGAFVPNLSFGLPVVAALNGATGLPLETHLMIAEPERYLEAFREAGSDILIVHQETCPHLHRTVQRIRELGARVGVAINPATPTSSLEEILGALDLVLVMTVNPGFGGQRFIRSMLDKVSRLRDEITRRGLACELEVDGGVDPETAPLAIAAGADVLVAGSAVFGAAAGVEAAITALRGCRASH